MGVVGFDECFRRQYPRLVALGVAVSGSVDVARDLAQETMMRAHARWDEITSYEQPDGWMRRVMSNLLIDHHRSARAERDAMQRLASRTSAVAAADAAESDSETWHRLLAALPARQRVIVTLYYGEDLSVETIASELVVAAGTVKSALGKARTRLQQVVMQEAGDARHQ